MLDFRIGQSCWNTEEALLNFVYVSKSTSSFPPTMVLEIFYKLSVLLVEGWQKMFLFLVSTSSETSSPSPKWPIMCQLYTLTHSPYISWLVGSVVERRSLTGELSMGLHRTCSWWVTIYIGKPSAVGQPSRPTQPFILTGVDKWVSSAGAITVHSVMAPSGELRGKDRYDVLCSVTTVWSIPECFRGFVRWGAIQINLYPLCTSFPGPHMMP